MKDGRHGLRDAALHGWTGKIDGYADPVQPDDKLIKTKPDSCGYECPRCGQLYNTNPEDPPPPHTKPDSTELCISPSQWRESLEDTEGE